MASDVAPHRSPSTSGGRSSVDIPSRDRLYRLAADVLRSGASLGLGRQPSADGHGGPVRSCLE